MKKLLQAIADLLGFHGTSEPVTRYYSPAWADADNCEVCQEQIRAVLTTLLDLHPDAFSDEITFYKVMHGFGQAMWVVGRNHGQWHSADQNPLAELEEREIQWEV